MNVGRITYINCYPVYGAIDRNIVPLEANIVNGIPTALNKQMNAGTLDVSVVSAVEYARDAHKYLLLPDLAISCDGPVRSVMLFSKRPAEELNGRTVIVSKSSMTSVALLELLFENVWHATPKFVPGDAEITDIARFGDGHDARLVIGDAALVLEAKHREQGQGSVDHAGTTGTETIETIGTSVPSYPYAYDLGATWKEWTGLPFVFAVWVAQRTTSVANALQVHARLIESRNWGITHLDILAQQAHEATGVRLEVCREYLSGLDYGLSYHHLAGLTEFFRRLVQRGRVPNGTLAFLTAA
jgi:chorismate dehydratase